MFPEKYMLTKMSKNDSDARIKRALDVNNAAKLQEVFKYTLKHKVNEMMMVPTPSTPCTPIPSVTNCRRFGKARASTLLNEQLEPSSTWYRAGDFHAALDAHR